MIYLLIVCYIIGIIIDPIALRLDHKKWVESGEWGDNAKWKSRGAFSRLFNCEEHYMYGLWGTKIFNFSFPRFMCRMFSPLIIVVGIIYQIWTILNSLYLKIINFIVEQISSQ